VYTPTGPDGLCLVWRDGDRLCLDGDIDQTNADVLRPDLIEDIRAGVVDFDLTSVRFFGAAGVRLLLGLRAEASDRGTVLRVACAPMVRRVLDICGVSDHEAWTLMGPPEPGRAACPTGEN
jgi:anti-anti-sigma factor